MLETQMPSFHDQQKFQLTQNKMKIHLYDQYVFLIHFFTMSMYKGEEPTGMEIQRSPLHFLVS